jgi:hypothetical protein
VYRPALVTRKMKAAKKQTENHENSPRGVGSGYPPKHWLFPWVKSGFSFVDIGQEKT